MPSQVSVVVATLNSARTLDMTLMSLRHQVGSEAVIQVVDSGSTDGTLEICQRWNVPTSYVPPGNMYRAINHGLNSCDTPWLTYINSDDYLYSGSLARLLSFGESQGADVVYGVCDYTDSEGRFVYSFTPAPPSYLPCLFRCGVVGFAQPATIFRKELFGALGGFDEQFNLSADADFFLRGLIQGSKYARLLGASVACFRLSDAQLSTARAAELAAQTQSFVARSLSPARAGDRFKLVLHRARNLPQYGIRVLRNRRLRMR